MQKCTVHPGHAGAQCHSVLLGRGPVTWPKLVAFGSPYQLENAQGVSRACAASAHRRVVTAARAADMARC
jgi:hypothetical protein